MRGCAVPPNRQLGAPFARCRVRQRASAEQSLESSELRCGAAEQAASASASKRRAGRVGAAWTTARRRDRARSSSLGCDSQKSQERERERDDDAHFCFSVSNKEWRKEFKGEPK